MTRGKTSPRRLVSSLCQAVFGTRTAFIVFLMTFLAFSYFFHRFRFWNVSSRLALTYAIVDDRSLRIDGYVNHPHYETQDRALYQGHYYSDKIIGLSLLAVPVYWAMKHAAAWVGKDPKPDLSRYGATVAVVSLPAALLMVVLFKFLLLLGQRPPLACAAVLFGAFGTMLFPFSSLFYPYLPSLFFLIAALYLLVRWRADGGLDRRPIWLPGGLVGLALLCEYTLAGPTCLIVLYAFFLLERRGRILFFLCAAAAPLSLFGAYNWVCFGAPFSLPYSHLEGPEFRNGMDRGLMGVHRFQWYVLYLITLHPYRGVFFYSPFLLLGLVCVGFGFRHRRSEHRALAWLIGVTVLYYLVLNASYYMWWGGGTLLARHLIPMLPFLILSFAWLPRRLSRPFFVLGLFSVLLMFPQSVVEPHFEPLYPNEALYNPWETVRETGEGFRLPFLRHSLAEFLRGRISMNPFNREIFATGGKMWTLLPLLLAETALFFWLRRTLTREGEDDRGYSS